MGVIQYIPDQFADLKQHSRRLKNELLSNKGSAYCKFFEQFISQLDSSEVKASQEKETEVWRKSQFWNCEINSKIISQHVTPRINFVDISQCTLSQETGETTEAAWDKIIRLLSQNRQIKRIKIENCNLGDSIVEIICTHMNYLTELDLRANVITSKGALTISTALSNLRVLYLRRNLVDNEGAKAIAKNLTKLNKLYLGSNLITNDGAISIATYSKSLTILYLWNNQIQNEGALAICCNMTFLKELWLST